MSTPATPPPSPSSADLPNDLPPVAPPSAAFIVQLFVFPAIIVMGVVGIWVLFGRIASSEEDWQSLVQDLGSPNVHSKRRAMYGLSQALDQDRRRGPAGQNLEHNTQIASALASQLELELKSGSKPEAVDSQVFLARALGLIDVPEATTPVLSQALGPQFELEVRKSAAASLALVADKQRSRQQTLLVPMATWESLLSFSQDSNANLRRIGAYTLGVVGGEQARPRLEAMLNDADPLTGINAAIGLARAGSTAGYDVLLQVLADAERPSAVEGTEAAIEQVVIPHNAIKAIGELADAWTAEQKQALKAKLEKIAAEHPQVRIRLDAGVVASALKP